MRPSSRLFLLAVLLTAVPGCASVSPMDVVVQRPEATTSLRFGVDTFAFPNESRTNNPGKPDLYANYCFVMARGVTHRCMYSSRLPGGTAPIAPISVDRKNRR
jgi:hypothetical protein